MAPRSKRLIAGLLAGAGALGLALPALGQKSPQSILPPGFNAPPQPAPQPNAPPPASGESIGGDVVETPAPAAVSPADQAAAQAAAAAAQMQADNAAEAAQAQIEKQDIPPVAQRPTDHIGFLSPAVTGIPADGFGRTSGAYLGTLLARLDAPVASRWVSILLRRVLTTDIDTPRGIDPADWAAERVLLLTRMGEADAARLLAERIDPDKATPRFYQAVLQAALASADPAALCPVADQADRVSKAPAWPLARAMCAGLSGEAGTASALVDRARSLPNAAKGIDLLLAQRVIGAGTDSRRATNIEWAGVTELTPWRFGLASAVGLAIPDSLFDNGDLAMTAWRARAPMLPLASRLQAERIAATLGVMSSADLVDFYSAMADEGDPFAMDQTPQGRLRAAYAARDAADRLAAMRALWADPPTERDQYASRILTARAAARVDPADAGKSDVMMLIQSMLSAGLDTQAQRWAAVVRGMSGTSGDEAWALMAVGAPDEVVKVDPDRVARFGDGGRGSALLRRQFLLAALAGLNRIRPRDAEDLARKLGVPLGAQNVWTRAIDAAAARREPATVALLAAVGMQTSDWTQVSPSFLYHIVAALKAVGFEPEARMVAAEALMRT